MILLSFVSLLVVQISASCSETPYGVPEGFTIRPTNDDNVKMLINNESRQKVANLVCFNGRWYMSMDPTTGRFPDLQEGCGNESRVVTRSQSVRSSRSSPRRYNSPRRQGSAAPKSRYSPRKLANYVSIVLGYKIF